MLVLGIETSCDETAVALLELQPRPLQFKLLENLIASQHDVHTPYGGIVPELASRRHIEVLPALVKEATKKVGLKNISGIAVTSSPGLVGSLLVGVSFAKALAFALKIPFIGVNHLEGHLNAPCLIETNKISYPQIALIVSGGHTALLRVKKFGDYEFLGGTHDDAAGEAFDKAAKILGLGYPGGPIVDKRAQAGDPNSIVLPKPKVAEFGFSFSGLKTALRVEAERRKPLNEQTIANFCASFQEVVVDNLIEKTIAAAVKFRCKTIVVTGGVACNSRLRKQFAKVAKAKKLQVFFPTPIMSTDNAAMIAYVGGRYLLEGKRSPLSLNATANVDLTRMGAANL